MCASILDIMPCEVSNCGGWGLVYMLVVLKEKVVDKILHAIGVPVVNGIPCFSDDLINFQGVSSVCSSFSSCGVVTWSLQSLEWLA